MMAVAEQARTFTDREVIAVVTKNRSDEIRIALTKFEDMHLVDVRVYSAFNAQESKPTKKGIAIRIGKLSALIAALQTALDEVRRRGLLPTEEGR